MKNEKRKTKNEKISKDLVEVSPHGITFGAAPLTQPFDRPNWEWRKCEEKLGKMKKRKKPKKRSCRKKNGNS
jgi:hypothetical protein